MKGCSIGEVVFSLLSWPFATWLVAWPLIRSFIQGDSFFAMALGRFYIRQLHLISDQGRYPEKIGKFDKWAFIYQNFLSVQLCYVILGRRIFVVTSMLMLSGWYLWLESIHVSSALILFIFLSSHIVCFIIAERGNYQTMGVVVASMALTMLQSDGVGPAYIVLITLALILSTSSFLLAGIVGILMADNLFAYIGGNSLLSVFFLAANFIFLNECGPRNQCETTSNSTFGKKILLGVAAVLKAIGVIRKASDDNPFPHRQISIVRGLVSGIPFAGVAPFLPIDIGMICILGAVIIGINQSKILRFFDFHLVYLFFFTWLFLNIDSNTATTTEFLLLFLVGSNPMLLYGLNRSNDSAAIRASRFIVPLPWASQKSNEVIGIFKQIFTDTRQVLIDDGIRAEHMKYNNIFLNTALLLEFIWDSFRPDAKFFPDWYSLFYTNAGFKFYKQIHLNDFSEFQGYTRISFHPHLPDYDADAKGEEVMFWDLSNLFGLEICNRYFPQARYMIIDIVPCSGTNGMLESQARGDD
ncbi:MAG: hypothetical protein G8345_01685 [Magnetococcales bacterium]|nr:hypothetical protein [Magnetococcales bacterium]NGZ25581.1 hypothetical protein [Magnetococcales bacterium]